MKKRTIAAFIVVLGLAGCAHCKKDEGDLEIIEDKNGETIKEGEVVELSAVARTEEGAVMWRSDDDDRPALVKRERSIFKGDLFAALGHLSEGDSAVVRISIDSMEIKMGVPRPASTKGRYLVYTFRIGKVVHKGTLTDSLYAAKVGEFVKARLERLRIDEPLKIRSFMAAQHWNAVVTGSGLYYSITQCGSGPAPVPVPGDTMEIKYTGRLMSGKVFTSTYPDTAKKANVFHDLCNPCKMTYDMYGITPGFNEMMMIMPKGSKMKALIPSALAYGKQGQGEDPQIQAYTPLVYEIEMVNIIHPHGKKLLF